MQASKLINSMDKTAKDFSGREFPMTDHDFDHIKRLAKQRTGIELGEHKKEMIYSRIVRRIRALRLQDFQSYLQYLSDYEGAELTPFINAITTNLTSFFREKHHFDFLKSDVLSDLIKDTKASQRIRIWSAGCSTGEEPYSIAMTMNACLGSAAYDAKILATDLDTNVLAHGKSGIYNSDRVGNMEPDLVRKYFSLAGGKSDNDSYEVKDVLKKYIVFNRLNLLGDWPMKGKFNVIFCRNVVIYFSKDTQRELFDRFATILAPGGYLFIGHSESLHGVSKRFESVGRTIYRKVA
jgi:chemotaxis protein methyltransferase CheR